MKKIGLLAALILTGVFLTTYIYNNFFSSKMLIGNYVNRNYSYQPSLPDIPYVADTLKVFANNKFTSSYWGKGTYNVFYSLTGTKIELIYKYEFGNGAFKTSINRLKSGRLNIVLFEAQNHYYEKLD